MTEGGPAAAPETDDRCVHQIVAGLARAYPARPAVTDGATTLTYGQLNSNATRLASFLSKFGLADPPIGLLLPRSADFVTAALAVLKAGGNYVPLDPDYPAERLQAMLAAAGCPVVISTTALIGCLPASSEAVRLRLDELAGQLAELPDTDPAGPAHADGLAYTMFTSGSTGVPKGVMITHRGIVRLVRPPGIVTIGATDVVLHASSVSFDAATFNIWGALVNGARLVIAPAGRTSVLDIAATIAEHQVTTVLLPTGLFHLTVDEQLQALRPLRQLVVGGDVLSAKHASRFQAAIPDCPLVNAYGPTEVTVATATQVVSAGADEDDAVPIGRAMAGTYIRLLDDDLRQVEPGIAGQLYAGGTGLARGYLGDPALTAQRFVPDPWLPGARLYATGDLARERPDGALEFLGRIDNQFKKRGFRVEPAEVEAALRGDPAVRDAVVLADGDSADTRRLVAVLVPESGPAEPDGNLADSVRERLRSVLPDYLGPDVWARTDSLPPTFQGKVDRKALLTLAANGSAASAGQANGQQAASQQAVEQQTEMLNADESVLASIWQDILDA